VNRDLYQNHNQTLAEDASTYKKLTINLRRSKELDQTENMDLAADSFRYADCANEMWNPEAYSLLYGTPLWEQSTASQRVKLNQLYWVAYYSQIISAEIATIFFNQTSAAGLYAYEDFRIVCDTLDLESAQERSHISAFKKVSEDLEAAVFGERMFTYPMRTPFVKTMVFSDLGRIEQFWRTIQLKYYTLLSSQNAFIGCQYFTVRGLRTLNGKMVQHQLGKYYQQHANKDFAPAPSKISYYHFLDESFHFNTSTCVSHDVIHSLKAPTRFETAVGNATLKGCQRDHFNFSTAINGIFWYDPDMMPTIYKILLSPVFGMQPEEAKAMMWRCFGSENEGMSASRSTHVKAIESYKLYLSDFKYVSKENKEMRIMARNSMERHLAVNRKALLRLFGPEHKVGHA
jgi:hypothetical protein